MSNKQFNAILKAIDRDIEKQGMLTPRTKNRMIKLLKECNCHDEPVLEGTGILSDAVNMVKTKVNNYVDNALNTRPGQVENLLKIHGDNKISTITIMRKPIQAGVKKFINLVTQGSFASAQKQMNYDDIIYM